MQTTLLIWDYRWVAASGGTPFHLALQMYLIEIDMVFHNIDFINPGHLNHCNPFHFSLVLSQWVFRLKVFNVVVDFVMLLFPWVLA